jgi:membrane fusion protein, multidrug efflux system
MDRITRTSWAWGVALIAFSLGGISCKRTQPVAAQQSVPVVAAEVLVRDQPLFLEAIGEARGSQDVEIRARVEGFLESVNFSEGRPVEAGTALYTIDSKPFEANLMQSKAMMAQAAAAWEKARRDTNRLAPLWKANAISSQQFDDALSAELSAGANLQAAQAAVDTAQIQLGYTTIRAPISGLAGKSEIAVGNLVGGLNRTLLTTISQIDPIDVRFSVSEREYLAWREQFAARQPGDNIGIFELILANGKTHPHRGDVAFADREVDPATGTLLLQARFPNPDKIVRPGQFARVRFATGVITNAVLVPQAAVQELQATYSVFVLSPESKAEFRQVKVGTRVGTFFVLTSGVKPGEKVIVEGIQKLQNSTPVLASMTNLVFREREPLATATTK